MPSEKEEDTWTLSEQQMATVRRHLERVLTDGCWVCKKNDWIILAKLSGEKPYDPNANYLALPDSGPKVRITCKNCGNAAYFSSDVIGLNIAPSEVSSD
ncbi:hypothetical protein [Sulfitobacter sp. 1A13679]|uniref:hypothetical protein n=1 Tax=Sulfitobacter sp. 1A13679 TaxID=3368597 RepID=UPI003746E26C